MTLEQLRIFVAVAEREHITQAARALNLTQSATSAAIAALEARHATQLFNRVGRRIELTEAGRLFLAEARAVLARAAAAENVLADLAELRRGSLRLAASQTVANYWLPPLMHRYRRAYPGIELKLSIGNTETVQMQVHQGDADLGFVEGDIADENLDAMPVANDELLLVGKPGLAPKGRKLTAADLVALPWVVREPGSGTRAMSEATLAALGVDPEQRNVVLQLPSNEAVRSAALSGAGVAVLSRIVVEAALLAGTLETLNMRLPPRRFYVLREKHRYATRAEKAFITMLERD
ncbi:MAG TPA: LysR family transcriptional regulator [Devosiaceae bacterium]